jgi:hypothetical protein
MHTESHGRAHTQQRITQKMQVSSASTRLVRQQELNDARLDGLSQRVQSAHARRRLQRNNLRERQVDEPQQLRGLSTRQAVPLTSAFRPVRELASSSETSARRTA